MRHWHSSRTTRTLALLTLPLLAVAGCSGGGGSAANADSLADMEPVEIVFSDILPENGPSGRAFAEMVKEVEEESDGKITFQPHYSGTLLTGADALSGIGSGVADMGLVVSAYYPQELPVAGWMNGLTTMSEPGFPTGVLQSAGATMETGMAYTPLTDELESHNLKLLWTQNNLSRYDLQCSKPVESLDDAKGKRVRVAGTAWADEVKALGMVPVNLPLSEMYEGLQRGVIDCAILHPASAIDFGLWEVAPYYTPAHFSGFNGNLMTMNLDTWNSLPQEAQQIIYDAGQTMWSGYLKNNLDYYEQYATEGVSKHKVEFQDPSALDAVLEPHQEEVRSSLVSSAPKGATDAQGLVDDYTKSLESWSEAIDSASVIPEDYPTELPENYADVSTLDWSAYDEEVGSRAFEPFRP